MPPRSEDHTDALEIIDLELEVVDRIVEKFRQLLANYFEGHGEIMASAQEIDRMEKESDRLERRLEIQLLGSETPSPWSIEYVHLANAIGKVANKVEDASDFLVLTRPQIPHPLVEPLLQIADITVEAFSLLTQAWKAYHENPTRVTDATHRVTDLEQRIDVLLWDSTRSLFSGDLDLAEKLHTKSLLDLVAFISNRIEEAAQVAEVLAIRLRERQKNSS